MIVFNQPTMLLPVCTLPGLFNGRRGHRSQQDPFQRLFSFRSVIFPHTNHPNGHWILACLRLITRWQECHVSIRKVELGQAGLVPMPSGDLEWTACLARPGSCSHQRIRNLCFLVLDAPILGRTYQKVCPGLLTGLKKWDPTFLVSSSFILSLCKMWVRIRHLCVWFLTCALGLDSDTLCQLLQRCTQFGRLAHDKRTSHSNQHASQPI